MAESGLYVMFPIIISALALIVSVLSYLTSNKSLKISEEEHKISEKEHELTIEKEHQKASLTALLEALNFTSKTLKELPNLSYFDSTLDRLMSDIMQVVYENKKLDLLIKLKYLYVNEQKIALELISNEKFLRNEIRVIVNNKKQVGRIGFPRVYYETTPKLPNSNFFGLTSFFSTLVNLEQNLDDLKRFELFINSFDSGFLDTINNQYDEILQSFYKTLNERTFRFEFNSDMKPSEIEQNLYESLNLTEMKDKSEFMATVIKSRVDEISKELTMRVLTQ